MRYIDTHCHLDFAEFAADRSDVIQHSLDNGVCAFIIPGVSRTNWDQLLVLTERFPSIKCALGIHPLFCDGSVLTDLDHLELTIASHRKNIVAVGEIGLDFWEKNTDRHKQEGYFDSQIKIASRFKLPLILHARKSHDQILTAIQTHRFNRGGVIHSFSGSEQQAERYLKAGFKLGIGGVITFERSTRLKRVVREFELSSFVLETDAPGIPTRRTRGERTSPEAIPEIFEAFAHQRPESSEVIADQLLETSIQIFPELREVTSG